MNNNKCYIKDSSTLDKIKNISENCTQCKLCVKECEMLKEFCKTPKELFTDILNERTVNPLIPYSCNMCDSCKNVCPKQLDLSSGFMDIRKELVEQNGGTSPLKGHNAVHMHQRLSFSKFFNTIIKKDKSQTIKRVFMPGCSLCSYDPELVFKTFNYLNEKLPGTAMLIGCCGKPTLALGEEKMFKKRYSKLQEVIDSAGVVEIITACQSCFLTVSKNSPKQQVKSLWNVFEEIGIPKEAENIGENSNLIFSIHDSCPTRYRSDIHDSVRGIMKKLSYEVKELAHCRENTKCCGTGGMVLPANPKLSLKIMKTTAEEVKSDLVVTYCASCRESMMKGGKKALHILDLIFGNTFTNTNSIPYEKSAISSWSNRLKIKIRGMQ